ncbi:hypothetical protein CBU02nite_27520 [Clostridium butyricum]|uniref:Uncharacterized protein n=1 Tax=Clostridium butyricum TaxID=1492 RepID=A0A512TPV9_CLOBU|nr:hypothetical protein [Clostridium butyricum]MDU6037823.1 hypothetical protein [Clostridium butyricum]NOW21783.1 hypothetical protein [Clostridium butyricum]GEQ22246.1 hypothetical protein CBU02nite_27520 [Clostridium butyricum]
MEKKLHLINSKQQEEERKRAYELAHEIAINLSNKEVSYSTAKLALLTAIEEVAELKLMKIEG